MPYDPGTYQKCFWDDDASCVKGLMKFIGLGGLEGWLDNELLDVWTPKSTVKSHCDPCYNEGVLNPQVCFRFIAS